MRWAGRVVVVVVAWCVAVPVMFGTAVSAFIFLPLPVTLPEAKAGVASRISHIYDIHGKEIGVFREYEQNIPVRPEDIPLHLKQAVVAAEDRDFYEHGGVDLRATSRALWADIRGRAFVQGGSTISQQYVKNAYGLKERTLWRKVREAVYAAQLDREFDKDTILFKYLQSIFLGDGAIGVGAASETYFRKPVSEITISEAALLVGIIPAPSRYAPRDNPDGAEGKRKRVLDEMLRQGYITPEDHADAISKPVWLATRGRPPGPVTWVYPPEQQVTSYPYFVDYLRRYLEARYGPEKVFRGGLRIQTTLEPKTQQAAEAAVADALKGTSPPLEMALAAVEPPTGYVKALVGGRDFYANQVNLALGACPRPQNRENIVVEAACWSESSPVEGGGTGRQTGSAWKPFVLAAAFAKGFQPTRVYSAPNVYRIPGCRGPKGCEIHNYEGTSFGSADLRSGTWKSINTVYAQLIRDVGIKETAEMAKKLGIDSAWYGPRYHGVEKFGLSYALGTTETSPLDMASAYGVFAARGLRAPATPVVKVVEPNGNVLEDNTDREPSRVIDEPIADNVTAVLRGVITSGTGTRANIGRPAAGKTGTNQDYKDAWFAGYTPTLSAAVWIGNRDKPTPLRGIRGVSRVAGGTIPAATWRAFMTKALADVPVTEFNEPAPLKPVEDELRRQARAGIDPGVRRSQRSTGAGGPYEFAPTPPRAVPPESTTTTEQPAPGPQRPSTTTTTALFSQGHDPP